ncbi:MAG: SDR family oxidoreductase [Phycisphaerales bacterium]|nr:SDR family oxidoreductase [Phycisphaerales bacterium]
MQSAPLPFSNRVVLVTGAASGIGRATARRFYQADAHVIAADIQPIMTPTNEKHAPRGHEESIQVDARDEAGWKRAADEIAARYGRLDALVHCAGITGIDSAQNPSEIETETWRRVMAVNVESAVIGTRACLPLLKNSDEASIVIVSSLAGRMALPAATAYAASKAALSSFARSLAMHCATFAPPIRVNSVAPGAIETPMWDAFLGHGAERAERHSQVAGAAPLKRFGSADEVAECIFYLASSAAGYVTGAEIVLDGGQSLT